MLHAALPLPSWIFCVLAIANGILLLAGLWTPYAGSLAIALSLVQMTGHYEGQCPPILLAATGAGVALVGPGAFSIDAWLFGLKRIDINKLKRPPRS
jgi:putative oxidoreductase